jgi:hypothetical protein
MMDGNVLVFAQVMTIVLGSFAGVIGISLATRVLWRLGSRAGRRPVPASPSQDELERLQHAVDAIAIEVERISEAQRFTVTLLSNRLPPPTMSGGRMVHSSGATVRQDTPH